MKRGHSSLILSVTFFFCFQFLNFSVALGFPAFGDLSCGQVNQPSCSVLSDEFWKTGPCDKGLNQFSGRCHLGNRAQLEITKENWFLKTLDFQNKFFEEVPLDDSFILRALNSEMYKDAFPEFETNQVYGLTDLLNLGVRSFSLSLGAHDEIIKVCPPSKCNKKSRAWFQWIEEISIWLRRNHSEVILIDLKESPANENFKLVKPIEVYFSSILFRPTDKKENTWPTRKELLEKGKRILFFSSQQYDKNIFHKSDSFFIPKSNERGIGDWTGQQCLIKDQNVKSLKEANDQKAFTLEDHEAQGQYLSHKDIAEAVGCGVNVLSLINIDIEKIGASIWSFEEGIPKKDLKEENICVYIQPNGRWMNGFCEDKKSFVCEDKKKLGHFKITTKKGMWDEGEEICNESFEGFKYAAPKKGESQKSLLKSHNKSFPVWINQLVSKNNWPGYYAIVPEISGRPLFGWYKNVRQWSWMNNTFQMWSFVPREEGLFLLKNVKTGLCMSVADGLSENAANVILGDCTGGDEQLWKLEDKGSSLYWVKNKNSQKCLDLEKTKKNNFDSVMQWKCHDVSQHKFRFLRVR